MELFFSKTSVLWCARRTLTAKRVYISDTNGGTKSFSLVSMLQKKTFFKRATGHTRHCFSKIATHVLQLVTNSNFIYTKTAPLVLAFGNCQKYFFADKTNLCDMFFKIRYTLEKHTERLLDFI